MKHRMRSRLLALLMAVCILCTGIPAHAAEEDPCVAMLNQMTTREKISQMIMPTFRYWTASGSYESLTAINPDVAACIHNNAFGGVIFFAENAEDTEAAVRLVDAIQQANAGERRTQLLTAVDQEGGIVHRLGEGTQMPGNMALGAVGDTDVTAQAAALIGEEIKKVGFNVDFAPVVDVNSNPGNPVIGVRSFSDDPALVAQYGVAFMQSLQQEGVIPCLKHFPGHGDTATDSHTGLPSINKSYETLKQNELIPFQACIDAGAEMIMTAHIQYPNIETATYRSIATGQDITLPATLSKRILTDILRGDMGYEGVIVTDAMEMDAIRTHFDRLDAAELAINAGVDIILTPTSTASPADLQDLETYLDSLTARVKSGAISIDAVNAAVLRILRLKERHGMLEPYDGSNLTQRIAAAQASVGSAAHKQTEWEISKASVTLVKNDSQTLPIPADGSTVLVLTPYDGEVALLQQAIDRLQDEGKLKVAPTIRSYRNLSPEETAALTRNADHVVIVSEMYRAANLDPNDSGGTASVKVDAAIAQAHASGADVTILSASLPYDAARYPQADALAVVWSDQGMVAGLYMILAGQTPTGHLPVNIPQLDGSYHFTDSLLYARGYGIHYGVVICDQGQSCPIRQFRDLSPTAWYHDGVHYVLDAGIMNGTGGGLFEPETPMSRAMLVTMLWRMEGEPDIAGGMDFRDVPQGQWYTDAIRWASAHGIVEGNGDGTFDPDGNVTREQMAKILYGYTRWKDIVPAASADLSGISDAGAISDWARAGMEWAVGAGLIQGRDTDQGILLAPGAPTERAEGATVLQRLRSVA